MLTLSTSAGVQCWSGLKMEVSKSNFIFRKKYLKKIFIYTTTTNLSDMLVTLHAFLNEKAIVFLQNWVGEGPMCT
jgi:hypothetical protein